MQQVFGPEHLDLHAGGVDLQFPHHENEMAQSQAYSGSGEWCLFFVHAGHLLRGGGKMSKSVGNTESITVRCRDCSVRV